MFPIVPQGPHRGPHKTTVRGGPCGRPESDIPTDASADHRQGRHKAGPYNDRVTDVGAALVAALPAPSPSHG